MPPAVPGWTMGWLLCKTIPYLQGVSVNASINTLVAISVERCLAICYPLRWQMTSRACRKSVIMIWLISLTITLPWAVFFKLQTLYEGSDFEVRSSLHNFGNRKTTIYLKTNETSMVKSSVTTNYKILNSLLLMVREVNT